MKYLLYMIKKLKVKYTKELENLEKKSYSK